jgi:nucleotide-binding universal stress UspA family protein
VTTTPATPIDLVVVPVDGSPFAARAVAPGRLLAERLSASVTLIKVVAPEDDEPPSGPVPGAEVLVGTDAGDAIGEYADRSATSVICMATHGRGWPASVFIGSAASLVIARSERPLILVGPACDSDWALDGGALIAAVDGQPGSEAMLPVAAHWAAMLAVGLTVVTVAEPAPPPLRPDRGGSWPGPGGDAEAYIDKLVASLSGSSIPVNGRVIWDPINAVSGLRGYLDEVSGDRYRARVLLAIANHGRGRHPGVPLGRTALHIVNQSKVPCLVVPTEP